MALSRVPPSSAGQPNPSPLMRVGQARTSAGSHGCWRRSYGPVPAKRTLSLSVGCGRGYLCTSVSVSRDSPADGIVMSLRPAVIRNSESAYYTVPVTGVSADLGHSAGWTPPRYRRWSGRRTATNAAARAVLSSEGAGRVYVSRVVGGPLTVTVRSIQAAGLLPRPPALRIDGARSIRKAWRGWR